MIAIAAICCFIGGTFFGVMLTLTHVETVKTQLAELQERNDRLTEAVSQPQSAAPVMMPRKPVEVEPSTGWWDTRPPLA